MPLSTGGGGRGGEGDHSLLGPGQDKEEGEEEGEREAILRSGE